MRFLQSGLRSGLGRVQRRLRAREEIYFLHIGKTAGTQLARMIKEVNKSQKKLTLLKPPHSLTLKSLAPDQAYFFSTRDPVTRFKSGFYSRKRKGQPRIFAEWSDYEARAFGRFEHANELAEALFAPGKDGLDATAAIRSIRHISSNMIDWFEFRGHLFDLHPPVWIIRQECFDADVSAFLNRIGYDKPFQPSTDARAAHANDYSGIPELSDTATRNLRRWYAQDYAFLDLCEAWRNEQTQAGQSQANRPLT